jgi:hypothetical protein|tara:strand:- start:244 stop:483 length:240 start_codon:yes stop_codon:yes gene_type:complete
MDILDEPKKTTEYNLFKKEDPFEIHEYLSKEDESRLINIIKRHILDKTTLNEYYRKISDFWKSVDEEEFAEEILLRVND